MYAEVVGQNELPNGTTVDPHVAEPLSPMKGTIMKALVLTGVKEFELQDLPTPEILPNEVLINTAYAGVCGTDHDLYAGRPGSAAAVPPIVLGHENSGVVAAVGADVTNVKVGDRVAVDPNIYCGQCEFCLTQRPELCDHLSAVGVTRNGGLAEQFTAPATVVYKLPDNVSLRDASAIDWKAVAEDHLAFWKEIGTLGPLGPRAPHWLRQDRAALRQYASGVGQLLAARLSTASQTELAREVLDASEKIREEPVSVKKQYNPYDIY